MVEGAKERVRRQHNYDIPHFSRFFFFFFQLCFAPGCTSSLSFFPSVIG